MIYIKRLSVSILSVFIFVTVFAEQGRMSPATAHFLTLMKENKTSILKQRYFIKKTNAKNYVNAFLFLNDTSSVEPLESLGVNFGIKQNNIYTAHIPVENLDSVSKLVQVKYLQIGTKVKKKMNMARPAAKVDYVQNGTDLSSAYTGNGVVVGVIDNGFQYNHINFYNSDGTATRVKRVWDQNGTGNPPSGYSYGREYTTQATIFAAKNDSMDETHATHVAGIAAGGDKNNSNTYYGVAPNADLVFVSMSENDNSADNVTITEGIKYIYDYATSVNKPCVVNMSLGSHYGPHDGTSAFDQVCDGLQGNGRLLVGSAGNEGGDDLHISKTFTAATDTLKTFFKFWDTTSLMGQADIWGEVDKNFKVQVVIYQKSTAKVTFASPLYNAISSNGVAFSVNETTTGVSGNIYIYTETNPLNNKPNALVYVDLTKINSGYYVGIKITSSTGTVHAWADDNYSYFSSSSISGWVDGNSEFSVGEVGGSGKKIISVGAYTSKSTFTNKSSVTYSTGETNGYLASFSSKGPTADNRIKPDITAPGSILASSFSDRVATSSDYSTYLAKKSTVNGVDYYYGYMQGTSMSAPFVTGVLATWLEAKNDLSPDDVRTILSNNSIADSYTGTIASTGNNSWGFGKIDAWNGIKACLQMTALSEQEYNNTIKVYPNPCYDQMSALFPVNDSKVNVIVRTLSGQEIFTKNIGTVSAGQEVAVDVNQLPKGTYLVSIIGNKENKTVKITKN